MRTNASHTVYGAGLPKHTGYRRFHDQGVLEQASDAINNLQHPQDSDLFTRRTGIKVGGLALLGLMLDRLGIGTNSTARAAETTSRTRQTEYIGPLNTRVSDPGISMILVVTSGGLSKWDTFSPLSETRGANPSFIGPFSEERTSLRGETVNFTEAIPKLARQMHRMTLIKSLFHDNIQLDHNLTTAAMFTGNHMTQNPMDSYAPPVTPPPFIELADMLSNSNPNVYALLHFNEGPFRFQGGRYGSHPHPFSGLYHNHRHTIYSQYNTANGAFNRTQNNGGDIARYRSRRPLLEVFDNDPKHRPFGPAVDRAIAIDRQADLFLNGDFDNAFDLTRVPDRIRDKFGKNPFGDSLVTALRMVEKGAKIIVVSFGDCDFHDLMERNCKEYMPAYDQGLAALVEMVDMLDLPIVVVGTDEFNRTPRINNIMGRDHWGEANTMVLSGRGIPKGRVIGGVDERHGVANRQRIPAKQVPELLLNLLGYAHFEINSGGIRTRDRTKPSPFNLVTGS